mmetsp:Transcript_76474/g.127429  ORF Transcript_76474/g.127429 Transcript_76474/m.127429 type:complete len:124 (+) Transcript_76474:590-961(+)
MCCTRLSSCCSLSFALMCASISGAAKAIRKELQLLQKKSHSEDLEVLEAACEDRGHCVVNIVNRLVKCLNDDRHLVILAETVYKVACQCERRLDGRTMCFFGFCFRVLSFGNEALMRFLIHKW